MLDIIKNITRLYPRVFSMEEAIPECPCCYQRLESREELDINLNPRELCCDCLAAEEALFNWETA
ncbi:MAG: hypothetical protein LBC63_08255 [Holophagales bacterium]|jgi:hypothetical protein|nr:hypothetical protein [Holophagales bacterium]